VSQQPQQDEGLIAGILRALVPALIIALVIRTVLFQAVSIPSGSMQPTLLIGDDLMVSKFTYGYSRYSLPFGPPLFSGRAFPGMPKRGDIIVFRRSNAPSACPATGSKSKAGSSTSTARRSGANASRISSVMIRASRSRDPA
jgi:hypothetical protein